MEMFSEPPPLAHVRELMPAALGPLTAASRTLFQAFLNQWCLVLLGGCGVCPAATLVRFGWVWEAKVILPRPHRGPRSGSARLCVHFEDDSVIRATSLPAHWRAGRPLRGGAWPSLRGANAACAPGAATC